MQLLLINSLGAKLSQQDVNSAHGFVIIVTGSVNYVTTFGVFK